VNTPKRVTPPKTTVPLINEPATTALVRQMALAVLRGEVNHKYDVTGRIIWCAAVMRCFNVDSYGVVHDSLENGHEQAIYLVMDDNGLDTDEGFEVDVSPTDNCTVSLNVGDESGTEYRCYFSRDGSYHIADVGSANTDSFESIATAAAANDGHFHTSQCNHAQTH
jgi:hypothetical protein